MAEGAEESEVGEKPWSDHKLYTDEFTIRKKHRYTAELFGILENFFLSVTFQVR